MSQKLAVATDAQAFINTIPQAMKDVSDLPKRYSDAGVFVDADLSSLPGAPTAAALTNVITLVNQLKNLFGNAAAISAAIKHDYVV